MNSERVEIPQTGRGPSKDDWQSQIDRLQGIVCTLLIKNQVLRMGSVMSEPKLSPRCISFAGGEIMLQTERDHFAYDSWHFAPARSAGDFIYVSGIIVARDPDQAPSSADFAASLRGAFQELGRQLQAYGCSFQDIVMLTTFHDWSAPEFSGDATTQAKAFQAIKDEFISEPHPAWTAIGTTRLVREGGILEIQAVVYSRIHRRI
jgi:enamine deaminase RidA (YjgF/YER057c/UK114 family)